MLYSRALANLFILYIAGVLMSPFCSVHRLNPGYHVLQDARPAITKRLVHASDACADDGTAFCFVPGGRGYNEVTCRTVSARFEKCIDKRRLYIATSRLIL